MKVWISFLLFLGLFFVTQKMGEAATPLRSLTLLNEEPASLRLLFPRVLPNVEAPCFEDHPPLVFQRPDIAPSSTLQGPIQPDPDILSKALSQWDGLLTSGLSESDFRVEVEYAPKSARPGYVFRVTLFPQEQTPFPPLKQNIYFLIDRSSSMDRSRFDLNKQAVASALALLPPESCFNILFFDNRILSFQERCVPSSHEMIAEAQAFLEKQEHGGCFAATELYASLETILPSHVDEEESHLALLFSEGASYLTQEQQRKLIKTWTARNRGKITLCSIASGEGTHLSLLELLSIFNKGVLLCCPHREEFTSRFSEFMRSIHNPIGKKIVSTALSPDPAMHIRLKPKASWVPDMYQHRPLVIYGSTNKLSDFFLFIQGHSAEGDFDIKKKISFAHARLALYSVEKNWTYLLAHEYYERYFEEGDLSHLEHAKRLLLPFNPSTPYIQ